MSKNTLYMESTEINASRTAGEITQELVRSGARQIAMDFGEGGRITGMHWVMRVNGSDVCFSMPARTKPIYDVLKKKAAWSADADKIQEKAERVAWRQLLRWIQAQNAMIETGMVQPAEVFMAYVVAPDQSTMFEHWSKQIAAGPSMPLLEPAK